MFRLSLVFEAQDLSLGGGDSAHGEGIRLIACLSGRRTGIGRIFKVEPVIAVLHTEDMGLDIVVIFGDYVTRANNIESEVDQPALDAEQAAEEFFLAPKLRS